MIVKKMSLQNQNIDDIGEAIKDWRKSKSGRDP